MSPKNIAGMTNNGWLCFQLLLLLACSRGGSSVGSSASDPIRGDQLHWQTYPWQCNDGRVIGASEYPVMVSCYHIAPGSCVDTTKVIGNCNTDPPELGNHENKRMFQNANDDDIAVFYWCKHDERMSTGERGIFTYCIDGAWTPIDDDCLPGSSLSGNSLDNKPIRDNLYEWKYSWHCKDGNDGRVIDTSGYPVMLGCSHIVPISCVDTTKIIGNCDTNPPQLDNHDKKKEFQNANDDDIAVHYWCKFDERMSTGERGIFTYCIDGEWTPIDDECFPECNEGRECSELNEDSSNNYDICPMKYGDPVKTYCYMEKRLTLVLRIERGSDTLDFTKAAAQNPQGNTGSNFFIGLKNLIGIHWQDNNSIPHDLVIYGKIGSSQTKEWTTYNNFLLNRTGFVVSLGSNMGALGDVVRDIEGKEFCPGDGEECWWGKYNDLLGYSTAGDNQDDFVEVWVRPHTGKIVLCPHNFVRSRDGKSCLTLVATKGDLVNNTQECAKRYSSLAFITHFDDVKRLKNDSLILTGYYVKEKNDPYDYIPALPDANVITSDTNVTRSHMSNLDLCVAMKHSDMNHWYLTYCHKDNMNAICMVPVTCPENYEIVGVLCYKLIASSSPEPTFLDALATCNTEGSGLAHPTNISQLNKLAEFIANNVDWSAHDVADVAIGLNVAFGNASLGGMYEISDEVHNAVNGSSVEGTQHLFLSVTQNASWVLKPADFNDFTSFYVCEFHGPLGCWTFPPHSKNMSTERTFTNRTVHESVTYSCNRGFFVNAEVGNKATQHRQCHGQLGGWAPLEPLIPCIGVVVCNESLPSHPHMTIENSKYPGYETYWMKYICYPGMGTADGKVKQKFTCTEYNGTYDYDGTEVEECNRCLTPPDEDVPNSKPTNSSGPWMVNSMVTVTCEDNYLVDRNMIDQQVLCTLKGWDSRDCHKVCLGEPLVGNATTTWRDDMWLVNDTINATCLEGYHFIEANTTEMLLSCEYDGWEDLLACEKVCQDDLEVGNATTEKSGSVWLVGRINTVTCFSEHRFLSINDATKEVECQFEGWEETEGCLKVCEDEPTVSSASSDWTSAEPWPEGSSVEVTCDTGLYQYPSLETQQTLECTYEGWTSATICEQVCFEAPDLTEYKALWNDSIPPGRLHDEISINCRSSHYHNESLDNTTIPAVCTPDGWQATYPCILSCKEPPDFGTVIMEWLETEPGRFGDEVIMECPNKHRNSEDISLTTITVGCTAEGWKTLTTCMKCCEEAPDAANLNIMWPSGLVDIILSKVTVDCLDDYYSEENLVSNTTVAQCTGDGWLVLKPCVRVCAETPQFGDVPIDWGTRGRGKVSQEVSLDCPEGYRNNDSLPSSTTTVSCTLHGWVNLDECVKACVEDPDAASMNINWEPLLATLGTEVEVDCLEEHYSNETLTTTITTVQCVEEGWWVTYPCVRVCTEKPDFGNVSVEWEERGPGRMGDNITLDCPAGYRSTDHLHLNTTLVTCTDHGWENVDPCVNVCLEEDLGGVAIEEEELGQWRVDEVVARACPEDFLTFKEAVNVTDFICTAEGWTNPDPCVNVCRERLYPVNGEANWNQRIWTAGHKLLVICLSQHHVSPDVYSYTVPCTDSGWYNVNSSCTYYKTSMTAKKHR